MLLIRIDTLERSITRMPRRISQILELHAVHPDEHHFGFDLDMTEQINNLRWTGVEQRFSQWWSRSDGQNKRKDRNRALPLCSKFFRISPTEKTFQQCKTGRLLGGSTIIEDSSSSTRFLSLTERFRREAFLFLIPRQGRSTAPELVAAQAETAKDPQV